MDKKPIRRLFAVASLSFLVAGPVFGMHIMEGFLSPSWAALWWAAVPPALFFGIRRIGRVTRDNPGSLFLLAMAGAFIFVLSALKLPSVTGSCSHPTGPGLAAILFGPAVTAVLGSIVLLFQALLLAHGGLTTLGANIVSMALAGPLLGYGVFRLLSRSRLPFGWTVFLAAFTADLATYVVTSIQLALAFPDPVGGFPVSLAKFAGLFALTQIPLAVSEGLLTVMILGLLQKYAGEDLASLRILPERR